MTTAIIKLPAIGSQWIWHNRRSQRVYTAIDCLVDENGSLEVRYLSEDMTKGEYSQRSVESFYSTTSSGEPRFIPLILE